MKQLQVFGLGLMVAVLGALNAAGQVRAAQVLRQPSAVPALVLPPTTGWQLVRVLRVVDADTYDVEAPGGRARVRLLGADAPEANQPYGRLATAQVSALVLGKYVWLQVRGRDGYGRTLAAVRLRPAAFSGQRAVALDSLLVVRGWAWAYDPDHVKAARAAEQQRAQAAGLGLWKCGTAAPVRPGVWRSFNQQEKLAHWGSCTW